MRTLSPKPTRIILAVLLAGLASVACSLLQFPAPAGTSNTPVALAVGDFNGDGFPDVAIADQGSDKVTLLVGDGTGAFSAAAGSSTMVPIL